MECNNKMRREAHFYMPLAVNDLARAYNHAVNWRELREALRVARTTTAGLTLDEASDASGLNRATIHSIENVKREPDLKPELETIEKLTRAYELTLSAFFAQIETAEKSGPDLRIQGLPVAAPRDKNHASNSPEAAHDGRSLSAPDEDALPPHIEARFARIEAELIAAKRMADRQRKAAGTRRKTTKRRPPSGPPRTKAS